MPDFTSALYLGLTHEAATLRPWKQLTTGKPSALQTLPGALALAADLAALTGSEAASLGPSTLHLFWDLFDQWPHRSSVIYADAELYETGRWGIERAACRGVRTARFNHYDADSLRRALGRDDARGAPVVVADGFCPDCGRAAPVPSYLDLLKSSRGWLVIDDTQALGMLGNSPGPAAPLGRGGGGTLRWYGAPAERVVTISSLAKSSGCRWRCWADRAILSSASTACLRPGSTAVESPGWNYMRLKKRSHSTTSRAIAPGFTWRT